MRQNLILFCYLTLLFGIFSLGFSEEKPRDSDSSLTFIADPPDNNAHMGYLKEEIIPSLVIYCQDESRYEIEAIEDLKTLTEAKSVLKTILDSYRDSLHSKDLCAGMPQSMERFKVKDETQPNQNTKK